MVALARFAAHPFKRVIAIMKDLLTDVHLRFEGHTVSIVGVDPEKVTITSLCIECEKPVSEIPVRIGIYLGNLYKFIRSVNKDDDISMTVDNNTIVVEIFGKERYSEYRIQGLELPDQIVEPPPIYEEQALALVNTLTFQKAIREVCHDSTKILINFDETGIITLSSGDTTSGFGKVLIHPCTQGTTWAIPPRKEFNGMYFIKYLDKFARGSASKTMLLTFKDDHLLVLTYFVAAIEAKISFFVAPIQS